MNNQELVEQIHQHYGGSFGSLSKGAIEDVLNHPIIAERLEIAKRYEEAAAIEVHKYPRADGSLAQFYKHLAGVTENLEPGTYALVRVEQREEKR